MAAINRFRSIWISDTHLGTRGCKVDFLLDFLRHNESDYLYLVGDIVDGWSLKRTWYWTQQHNDVIQKILRKARKGTRVVYIPGNHDEFLRDYLGSHFGGVEVFPIALTPKRPSSSDSRPTGQTCEQKDLATTTDIRQIPMKMAKVTSGGIRLRSLWGPERLG